MQDTHNTKSYGNGFDHMESEKAIRAFIAWWNEKSFFPFDGAGADEAPADRMAA